MKLLLIDGTNIVMRCGFGGDVDPAQAVPTAAGMIRRAAREVQATHAVIAFDFPDAPSWRAERFPGYKADRKHRQYSTSDYLAIAGPTWAREGWRTLLSRGFEADDIIATLVARARGRAGVEIVILSGDSDLQALVVDPDVAVLRPQPGGFELMREAQVCAKHGLFHPSQLASFKALAGEPGDGIPGPFGKKCEAKARKLLEEHGSFDAVLPTLTLEQLALARQAYELVQLRIDVPLPAIAPASCVIPRQAVAA